MSRKEFDMADENKGILFHNDRKQTDKHPDRSGKAKICGIWYWISAWDKQGQRGDWLSLAFTEMTAEQAAKAEADANQRANQRPAQPQRPQSGYGQQRPTAQPQSPQRQQSQPRPQNAYSQHRPVQTPVEPPDMDTPQFSEDDIPF